MSSVSLIDGHIDSEDKEPLTDDSKSVKKCANCGREIESDEEYFIVGDNYLQEYFDSTEDNIFCSKDCICSALSVLSIGPDGNAFPV